MAVWVGLADFSIWKLPHADAVRVQDILLAVGELNCLDATLFDFLNGAVGEDALLLSVLKDALNSAVRETKKSKLIKSPLVYLHDLFRLVWEVLLDLVVAKLEDLQFIREGRLRRLCLGEVVDNLAVGECLLDVLVVEVDNGVAVWEGLTLDSVVEDDFLFAVLVDPLDLPIMPHVLLNDFLV